MLRAGALRDGMGREVGGGFRMRNTCTKEKKINILSIEKKKKIKPSPVFILLELGKSLNFK